MSDMFAAMILGHLAGDYLLQNRAMMLGKSKPGLYGHLECALHCLFYSLAVCASIYWFTGITGPAIAAIAFTTHWPIDRWSLAKKWMALIKSREPLVTYTNKEIDAAFYAVVYTVTDNALHLILMYAALRYVL